MAKLSILAGATSQSVNVFILNSSLTTGAGLTGLVFNTSSLTGYYTFVGANTAATAITLATLAAANSAYSSGGFKEIDATNMPGLYRLDIPNAALAGSSGRSVVIMLKGAANMAPCLLEIELTAVDNQSTAYGLVLAKTTNITGFNDIAATAVVSSGAITTSGGAVSTVSAVTGLTASNLDATVSSRMATYTQPTGFLAATFPSGTIANTTNVTAGTITTATNLTNAPTAGDFTSTMKTSLNAATPAVTVSDKTGFSLSASQTFNLTGNITGNLSGSVGSVTGLTASDVGAIKTQTDKLTFTVANQLDSNILSVNSTTVTGDGQSGTEWGPV